MQNRPKILIIDDDVDLVAMMKGVLESKHYNVVSAYNGQEGLEKARKERPALIILDIMMPVMDGWTFADQFNKDAAISKIPVVALTSYSDSLGQPVPFEVAGFVRKPIKPKELVSLVEDYLKRAGLS